MLTLPQVVASPPKQPLMPSALLRGLPGVTHWWTPHQQMTVLNPQGYREVRPSAGPAGLVANTLESATPILFRDSTYGSRVYQPSYREGTSTTNFWRQSVALNAAWNTVVLAFRGGPEMVAQVLWNCIVNPSSGTPTNVRLLPASQAGSAGIFGAGPTQINSHFANPSAPGEAAYGTFAFNLTTGAVKYAKNGGAAEAQTNSALAGLVPDALSTFTFGARNATIAFSGDWLDLGIFAGVDLFAAPATRADIATYMNSLYGIA